jgi:hypothetical protein
MCDVHCIWRHSTLSNPRLLCFCVQWMCRLLLPCAGGVSPSCTSLLVTGGGVFRRAKSIFCLVCRSWIWCSMQAVQPEIQFKALTVAVLKSCNLLGYNAVQFHENQPTFRRNISHAASMLVSCLFFFLWLWRWRRHVLPKRLLTMNWLNGVISQNVEFFLTSDMEISGPTEYWLWDWKGYGRRLSVPPSWYRSLAFAWRG